MSVSECISVCEVVNVSDGVCVNEDVCLNEGVIVSKGVCGGANDVVSEGVGVSLSDGLTGRVRERCMNESLSVSLSVSKSWSNIQRVKKRTGGDRIGEGARREQVRFRERAGTRNVGDRASRS